MARLGPYLPQSFPVRRLRACVADDQHLVRVRKICMGFPEVTEVMQFGSPCWKAGKKTFAWYGAEGGGPGCSFNLDIGTQAELVKDPRFKPSHYVGQHGWTNMRFAGKVDWDEIAQLCEDAYRKVALKRMVAQLDASP